MNCENSRMAVVRIRHLVYGMVFLFAVKLCESLILYKYKATEFDTTPESLSAEYWMHSLFYFFLVHIALVILLALSWNIILPVFRSGKEIPSPVRISTFLMVLPGFVYAGLVAALFLTSPTNYNIVIFGPLLGWLYIDSMLMLPVMAGAIIHLRVHGSSPKLYALAAFPAAVAFFGLALSLMFRSKSIEGPDRYLAVAVFNLCSLVGAIVFSFVGGDAEIRLGKLEAGLEKA